MKQDLRGEVAEELNSTTGNVTKGGDTAWLVKKGSIRIRRNEKILQLYINKMCPNATMRDQPRGSGADSRTAMI